MNTFEQKSTFPRTIGYPSALAQTYLFGTSLIKVLGYEVKETRVMMIITVQAVPGELILLSWTHVNSTTLFNVMVLLFHRLHSGVDPFQMSIAEFLYYTSAIGLCS